MSQTIHLIGCRVDSGKTRRGCLMGPDALRTAGLTEALCDHSLTVQDDDNLTLPDLSDITPKGPGFNTGWTRVIAHASESAQQTGTPIFLEGDHNLSLGSILGSARHAACKNRPLFVLWLDAHYDLHTPLASNSGNLNGTLLGYLTGRSYDFSRVETPVSQDNICIIGLRSVDAAERTALQKSAITYHDMRAIDEHGISRPLTTFLGKVRTVNGLRHVYLDVDFIDPMFAPGVGTTVPGGATLREAHLAMEVICDSELLSALALVELNPFLDDRGATAQEMTDLAASALGRRVFDRPTLHR